MAHPTKGWFILYLMSITSIRINVCVSQSLVGCAAHSTPTEYRGMYHKTHIGPLVMWRKMLFSRLFPWLRCFLNEREIFLLSMLLNGKLHLRVFRVICLLSSQNLISLVTEGIRDSIGAEFTVLIQVIC